MKTTVSTTTDRPNQVLLGTWSVDQMAAFSAAAHPLTAALSLVSGGTHA
jgi:isopentenyl-diphosphate delta-isomerase